MKSDFYMISAVIELWNDDGDTITFEVNNEEDSNKSSESTPLCKKERI